MCRAFIIYTTDTKVMKEDAPFLIYLLEAFANLTLSDTGIEACQGTGLSDRIGVILDYSDPQEYFELPE
jgi:hypothetical protein